MVCLVQEELVDISHITLATLGDAATDVNVALFFSVKVNRCDSMHSLLDCLWLHLWLENYRKRPREERKSLCSCEVKTSPCCAKT